MGVSCWRTPLRKEEESSLVGAHYKYRSWRAASLGACLPAGGGNIFSVVFSSFWRLAAGAFVMEQSAVPELRQLGNEDSAS